MSLFAGIRERLSAEGYFGFQLVGGALAIIVAGAVFGAIAANIAPGEPLTLLDAEIATWFHVNAVTSLTRLMLFVSVMNGIGGTLIMTVAFAVILVWKRQWSWVAFTALAVPCGMLLNTLTKLAFSRARPSFDHPLVTLSTYSFPSGHTMASTLFYGTLAAFLMPRVEKPMRAWIIAAAVGMIALVGMSRIYLGAHYVTDVMAAIAQGVAWLSLCLIALATYLRRTRAKAG